MHPTGQGHDVSTPPSLNASWTVAQAPLERNSLVSSAAWTNALIPPKLVFILVVVKGALLNRHDDTARKQRSANREIIVGIVSFIFSLSLSLFLMTTLTIQRKRLTSPLAQSPGVFFVESIEERF
jgi:hypothetical protein